jgi:hypothetical protein
MPHLRSTARFGVLFAGLVLALGAFAPGLALADQAMHTVRGEFHSLNPSAYPLKDGFVVSTHMNGPVNFEKKEFQLHGAKPDTEYFLYRVLPEGVPGVIPAGAALYAGLSFWTDEHGNGHVTAPMAPTVPNLVLFKKLGVDHLLLANVLYNGLLAKDGGNGGIPAYATDAWVTYLDFDWTP